MSLDVYLDVEIPAHEPQEVEKIYVRAEGGMVWLTREQWDILHPGVEPVSVIDEDDGTRVYSANITHNLTTMAGQVGLYKPLWRPEEIGVTKAWQLIPLLREGLTRLIEEKERLQEFNPENGWGDYDGLVRFTQHYLAACEQHPDATVSTWR